MNTQEPKTKNLGKDYKVDCDRGCTNCGAKNNQAKSIKEMICLIRNHRLRYELKNELKNALKTSKTKPYEFRVTIF